VRGSDGPGNDRAMDSPDQVAPREKHLVELVDADGVAVGHASVAAAHTGPGRLHRAFSVLLVDGAGRLLLQRRAAQKTRFALRWANACCGHPAPGQPVVEAAGQRLGDELGLTGISLRPVGVHLYRAVDPATDRVEYEYDHVLLGRLDPTTGPRPDPTEVCDLRLMHPDALRADLRASPDRYAPWLAGILDVWSAAGEPMNRPS
jgi:isopentenyl-diphosphate Delta-isomerase